MSHIPHLILIEGNIGAGKSTLVQHLTNLCPREQYTIIPEPVHKWIDLLGEVQSGNLDPKIFQFVVLQSIVHATLTSLAAAPPNTTLVMERSLLSNLNVFAASTFTIDDPAHTAYLKAWELANECLPRATKTTLLYLRAPPNICFQRIAARARPQETAISLNYLEHLHHLHDTWLLHQPNCITIDASARPNSILETVYTRINITAPTASDSQPNTFPHSTGNPYIQHQSVVLNKLGQILSWKGRHNRQYIHDDTQTTGTAQHPWPEIQAGQLRHGGTPLYHTEPLIGTSSEALTQTHLAALITHQQPTEPTTADLDTETCTPTWHPLRVIRDHLHRSHQYALADAITDLSNRARGIGPPGEDHEESCLKLRAGMPPATDPTQWPTPMDLREANRTSRSNNTITFFSSATLHHGQFSNFYTMGPQRYSVPQWINPHLSYRHTIVYNSEQIIMLCKAALFNDEQSFNTICNLKNPAAIKAAGRHITPFDETRWHQNVCRIAVHAVSVKVQANTQIRTLLLNTGDNIIAEASPWDALWGIGDLATAPHAAHPNTWKGSNILGWALAQVRDSLQPHQTPPPPHHHTQLSTDAGQKRKYADTNTQDRTSAISHGQHHETNPWHQHNTPESNLGKHDPSQPARPATHRPTHEQHHEAAKRQSTPAGIPQPWSPWEQRQDPISRHAYYYNRNTGQSQWGHPTEAPTPQATPPTTLHTGTAAAGTPPACHQTPLDATTHQQTPGDKHHHNNQHELFQQSAAQHQTTTAASLGYHETPPTTFTQSATTWHTPQNSDHTPTTATYTQDEVQQRSAHNTEPSDTSSPHTPWVQRQDPTTGHTYYFNETTHCSQWHRPDEPYPATTQHHAHDDTQQQQLREVTQHQIQEHPQPTTPTIKHDPDEQPRQIAPTTFD